MVVARAGQAVSGLFQCASELFIWIGGGRWVFRLKPRSVRGTGSSKDEIMGFFNAQFRRDGGRTSMLKAKSV